MSSDELEQIMTEKRDDMLFDPNVDEEILNSFINSVLMQVRLWEE